MIGSSTHKLYFSLVYLNILKTDILTQKMHAFFIYRFDITPYVISTPRLTAYICYGTPNYKETHFFLMCMQNIVNVTPDSAVTSRHFFPIFLLGSHDHS